MDKMREEFEKMCAEIGVSTTKITVVDCGIATTGYKSEEVNEMFGVFCFAWKASRASLCVELPEQECGGDGYYYHYGLARGHNECLEIVASILDDAGVSYK